MTTGVAQLRAHLPLLRSIEADFGVPPEVVVAIWGIETNYGSYTGTHDVVQALVESSFLERTTQRGAWLRSELISALMMLDQGVVGVESFQGSYAGAVGQCQFMPSNFFVYAVDYDGDGKADIWASTPDALASIASFLRGHGYTAGASFGALAELPDEQLPGRDTAAISAVKRGGSFPRLREIDDGELQFSRGLSSCARDWEARGVHILAPHVGPDTAVRASAALVDCPC